jgi:hypothetical protein
LFLDGEADQSPPSSAEVKNAWSYTSIPPIRLYGVVFCYLFTTILFNKKITDTCKEADIITHYFRIIMSRVPTLLSAATYQESNEVVLLVRHFNSLQGHLFNFETYAFIDCVFHEMV